MIAITKKLSGFCISHKHRFAVGISTLSLAASLAQLHPSLIQAQGVTTVTGQPTGSSRAELATLAHGRLMADTAIQGPPVPPAPPVAPAAAPVVAKTAVPVAPSVPELVGQIGYARAGGNCVNEPGINNPRTGNPISWAVTSRTPRIGATALFTWNHAGVVTGIWSNGDIEVRHQNFWGGQTRFPQSMIRGYR